MEAESLNAGDYLLQVKQPWLRDMKQDLIIPLQKKALLHPFIKEARAGTLPRYKLRRLLSDVLWIVVGFPEYIAALAARCPRYNHRVKAGLLENAFNERTHPHLLGKTIEAFGGNPEVLLQGPEYAYKPTTVMWNMRNWIELCVYQKPWIEGVAACAVGIEAIVPTIFGEILKASKEKYGLQGEGLTWLEIHGGEVEQSHGNEGLMLLDNLVNPDDEDTKKRCWIAIERSASLLAIDFLDEFYAAKES
jgi:pyrroloquinoline quinone (PQQ) biosynthesis protein C